MTELPKGEDVQRLFGPMADHTVVEILETGARLSELEHVAMLLAQEDDVAGARRKPLTGAAAQVFDIVMNDVEIMPPLSR